MNWFQLRLLALAQCAFLMPQQKFMGVQSFVFPLEHRKVLSWRRNEASWTVSRKQKEQQLLLHKGSSVLYMAGRRSNGNKKNKPKKKKKPATTTTTTSKKTTKKNPPKAPTSSENPKKAGTKKKVAPPWQTISRKDIAQNVQAEKERRILARETGQHMTAMELEASQLSYQRSKSFLSPEDKALLSWKPFSLHPNKHEVLFQGAFLNKQLPPRLGTPEVAFLGRSNVGKSSLLNKLVGRSDLARVGKTPGATASVNLYGVLDRSKSNEKALLGLVDLPGFGYAKLDKATKESVQETAENYLAKRKELALGILLVDSRREPTMDDKAVLAALYDMGLPLMVVATKVDKFSTKPQVEEALGTINRELGLPKGQPLCISSVTGEGIKDLWKIILEACEGHVGELKTQAEGGSVQETTTTATPEDYYDDGEIAYSQGYDWIQGSVMYEGDDGDYYQEDEIYNDETASLDEYDDDDDEYFYDDDDDDDYGQSSEPQVSQKETLQSLRKRARAMEKRGEL